MAKALYRKYRSRSLKDVVGQDHVVETLSKALKTGRIRHAYLFSGPRGVGKTSVARILAHEINKLPYTDDDIHLDIIEIDAASNRRIDEVRDLRDKVNITPTSAKYKVYIIDEVHMLTREAFNALLKTLEEPPEHVIFILATTEAHKLPETITSRTQHFTFKPIGQAAATEQLAKIAKAEKIKISTEALPLLADYGQGSFRDSISLLDQLSSHSTSISAEAVRELIGLPPTEALEAILDAAVAGDSAGIMAALDKLTASGINPSLAAKALAKRLRDGLAANRSFPGTVELLKRLLEVPASSDPHQSLELSLLQTAADQRPLSPNVEDRVSDEPTTDSEPVPEVAELAQQTTPTDKKSPGGQFDLKDWPKVLTTVKNKSPALYTALRLATPEMSDEGLILAFEFPLHQSKVNQPANLALIGTVIDNFGGQVKVETLVRKKIAEPAAPAEKQASEPELENISNIFGNAEVLES